MTISIAPKFAPKVALGLAAVVAAALAVATPAMAETVDYAAQVAALGGDAAKGETVYKKCMACHVIVEPKTRPTGPHQVGIIGRPVAIIEDFKYSKAMMDAQTDNPGTEAAGDPLVWDVPTLSAYLADPKGYVKGTKMAFAGLKKEDDIKNVITYMFATGGVYTPPAQ